MRRQTFGSTGRRGTVLAASAAVLCLGGTLAACGGGTGDDDGYTAVGAAGTGPGQATTGAATPSGTVTLIPLDGSGGRSTGAPPSGPTSGTADPADGTGSDSGADEGSLIAGTARTPAPGGPSGTTPGAPGDAGSGGADSSRPGSAGGSSAPSNPATPSAPGSMPPAAPAALELAAPARAPADKRWCELVTVTFHNTGGTAARSGTVTFATHVIGGLGVDWATVRSTQPLPAPIGAGAVRKKTYTVCVDAWRVPLGMRVETQDVTAVWK